MSDRVLVWTPQEWTSWRTKALSDEKPDGDRFLLCKDTFVGVRTKEIDTVNRKVPFVISTGDRDRDGDTLDPNGWDLEDYKNNPVVLWGHDSHSQPPVARSERLALVGGMLKSDAVFPTREIHPFGGMLYDLVIHKFLNGASVGYSSSSYAPDPSGHGINFKRQKLFEWSLVPIPANPRGLSEAKDFGIDLTPYRGWLESHLDSAFGEPVFVLPRARFEEVYKTLFLRPQVVVPEGIPEEARDLYAKVGRELSGKNEAAIREAIAGLAALLERVAASNAGAAQQPEVEDQPTDNANGDPSAEPVAPGDPALQTGPGEVQPTPEVTIYDLPLEEANTKPEPEPKPDAPNPDDPEVEGSKPEAKPKPEDAPADAPAEDPKPPEGEPPAEDAPPPEDEEEGKKKPPFAKGFDITIVDRENPLDEPEMIVLPGTVDEFKAALKRGLQEALIPVTGRLPD